MNFSNRFFVFLITLIIFTGIGLIAGVNLIINQPIIPNNSNTNSDISSSTQTGIKMISEEPFIVATTSSNSSPTVPPKPKDQVTATAYLVGNVLTGQVYLSVNENQVLPVASMSKLMTAIVATNTISPTTTIEITPLETQVASDTSYLQAGEKFTLNELLRPLLLSSSNVAAEAIASSTSRLEFMKLMSMTAWEINMPTAYFADPSGLDPHNEASAKDIFALARYLYATRPDILEITRTANEFISTTTDHGSHIIDSTHPFVNDPRFIGGKTGRTPEAGETMLTILKIKNQLIAFIVLHSDIGARATDTSLLIDKYEAMTL